MSGTEREHFLAQDVDEPVPIMFWDPVVFVIAIVIFGFGILMNMVLPAALFAVWVLYMASKMKRGSKQGAAQHFVWAFGLEVDAFLKKHFPSPLQREFLE